MQAAFAKYANFTGVPGFDWYQGWLSADLMIKGLQVGGVNPTRTSFIDGLRKVTDYDAGGLLPNKSDFSLAAFGTTPATLCGYYMVLKGNAFTFATPDSKPI